MLKQARACYGRTLVTSVRRSQPPNVNLKANTHLGASLLFSQPRLRMYGSSTFKDHGPPKRRVQRHDFEASNRLAQQLKDTGVWNLQPSRSPKAGRPKAKGDKARVNIVNDNLVDDIIDYLQPTLERHKGCDLISVYPGCGLWSQALHHAVKPRSHLLLEPDEELYRPFLEPLLKEKGTCLIPRSGIVWQDLDKVLTPEYLPSQVEIERNTDMPPPQNDTLLVTMNLAMHPKKSYSSFDSVSRMVIYQLIQSLRTSTLFQKYGRVRMLIWLPDDEKYQPLPRVLHTRRKMAIEGELCTEYIAEVCGADGIFDGLAASKSSEDAAGERKHRRTENVELESLRLAMNRMRDRGIVTPVGRETKLMRLFKELGLPLDKPVSLSDKLHTEETGLDAECAELQKASDENRLAPGELARFRKVKSYLKSKRRMRENGDVFIVQHFDALQAFVAASEAQDPEEKAKLMRVFEKKDKEYTRFCESLPLHVKSWTLSYRDQVLLLKQPAELGPVLNWDRRPYEPLPIKPLDFFPNSPCSLLDIQPRAPHPLLRAIGPGTSKAGDIFDLLLQVLMLERTTAVSEQVENLYPGTAEAVIPFCKSVFDPRQGGSPLSGHGKLMTRIVNQRQLTEMLELIMKWPFRPHYGELLGRLEDSDGDSTFVDEEMSNMSSAMGSVTADCF